MSNGGGRVGEENVNASNSFYFYAIARHECYKFGSRNSVNVVATELPYGAKIKM
jgi:hypothetical protein